MATEILDTGGLSGPLQETVRQICAARLSATVEHEIVARASAGALHAPNGRWRLAWWSLAACAAIVTLIVSAWLVTGPSRTGPSQARTPAPAVPPQESATRPQSLPSAAPGPAIARAGQFRGMGSTVRTQFFAVSANATFLVATGPAANENRLEVWDWSRKDAERTVLEVSHSGPLAITPDGREVVTTNGRVVEVATGRIRELPPADQRIRAVHFSPDGSALLLFLAQRDPLEATVRILNYPAGTLKRDFPGQSGAVLVCAFTPDSREVVLSDRSHILRRWDVDTGRELAAYEPAFSNSIRAVAVSPDGKLLAAASANENYLWDLQSATLMHRLPTRQSAAAYERSGVHALAFSPDSGTLAASGIWNAFTWTAATGQPDVVLPRASGGGQLRFVGDGKLAIIKPAGATATPDGSSLYPAVELWDLQSGRPAE